VTESQCNRHHRLSAALTLAALAAAPICCHHYVRPVSTPAIRPPSLQPTTRPNATAAVPSTSPPAAVKILAFDDKKGGSRLEFPDDWKPTPDPDDALQLTPSRGGTATITYSVPNLPPHLPWMIKLDKIESGYVDDLKKSHADLKIEQAVDHPIPGGKGRIVQIGWKQAGHRHTNLALLMVHGNGVYILSADADAADWAGTQRAFKLIMRSIQWTKR